MENSPAPAPSGNLPAAAGVLLGLLRLGPRTWRELADAGLDRVAVLLAVGDIAAAGDHRVRLGPLLVELEMVEI